MLVSVLAFGWSGVAASHVVPCPPATTKVDRFAVNGTDWIACEDLKVRKKEKRDESLSETTSFSFSQTLSFLIYTYFHQVHGGALVLVPQAAEKDPIWFPKG